MSSILRSRLLKTIPALALGVACALFVGDARADEIAPNLSIQNMVVQVNHASEGASAFSCYVNQQAADGNFTCGSGVSGRITGVTNQYGIVVGHRVRMTRQVSSTVSETYTGAIERQSASGLSPMWMAGERTTTTMRTSCSGTRCLTTPVTDGPRPFVGEGFYISG